MKIIQRETAINNEGTERRGQSGADDSYNYQAAFNWGVQVLDKKELLTLLETEKKNPTEYDLTPKIAKIQQPIYRKTRRFVRKRKR